MPNLLADSLLAIRRRAITRAWVIVIALAGYGVILWTNWRIGVGFILLNTASNVKL